MGYIAYIYNGIHMGYNGTFMGFPMKFLKPVELPGGSSHLAG
jgi:hypothetical protein